MFFEYVGLPRFSLALVSFLFLGSGSAYGEQEESASPAPPPLPSSSMAVQNPSSVITGDAFTSSGVPVSTTRTKHALKVMDGVNVYAAAAVDSGYDDNVTLAPKGSSVGSEFLSIRPIISAEGQYREDKYALTYKGDFRRFGSLSRNDTDNNDLLFVAQNVFDSRTRVAWGSSFMDHYDPIGTTDRSIGAKSPDHHQDWLVNGTVRYGSDGAKGRIELDGGVGGKRYLNNRETTESADVVNTNVAGRFLYRLTPKTHVLTEVGQTTFAYVHDSLGMDNTERRYLLGLEWDATAATTGTLKFGEQTKHYDHGRSDYAGFTWEAAVRWMPLTYTSFDLITGRAATDPSGAAVDYVMTHNNSLAWNHDWTSYVHSKVVAGVAHTRYASSSRSDVSESLSAGVMYDFRRWLGLGLDYSFARRSSTDDRFEYVRNLIMLKAEASF